HRPLPRRAGVSSFGIGGSNAHVILEEYGPDAGTVPIGHDETESPALIVLSARNADRLRAAATNLLNYLTASTSGAAPSLSEVAYVLQVGREGLDERLAFTAGSMKELVRKLQAVVDGNENTEHVLRGRKSRKMMFDGKLEENLNDWIKGEQLSRLLSLWVQGLDFDWKQLYGQRKPRRISLPTYPFDRKRYWFTEDKNEGSVDLPSGRIILAPLGPQQISEVSIPPQPWVALSTAEPSPAISPVSAGEPVQEKLVRSLAAILLMDESELDLDSPFIEMGLDSVIGVEWVQSINKQFGIKVPATRVYDYPNIPAFTKFIEEEMKRKAGISEKDPAIVTPLTALSFDEILDRVQQKTLDIAEAERLLEALGLHQKNGGLS
ncbi:MAG: putative polyketide synthase pksM, partial [Verrucomicrobiota bacterium]